MVSDADYDSITLTVAKSAHGTLAKNKDGTYTYTPDKNYTGNDSFSYTVSDGKTTTTALISLVVANNGSSSITVNSVLPPSAPALPQLKSNVSFEVIHTVSADKTEMPAPVIDWNGANGLSTCQTPAEQAWMLDFLGIKKAEDPLCQDSCH